MKSEYHITLKQQFLVSCSGLIKYLGLAIICVYFLQLRYQPIFSLVILFFFIVDILPAIVLHLQYRSTNSDATLIIDRPGQRILYRKSSLTIEQQFSDINSFELVSSYGGGQNNVGWYAFGEYRYCKIGFRDNTQIVVTCLMMNDIQNTFESLLGIKLKRRKKIFAFISSTSEF